ncbi:NAD(P)-dependent oxidoreductase [Ramlibacter tataouinensis]|uniref:TsaR n=1 Tax=Ramlibacter tataouinensis (strain ATCC BAA-407 / DSM 14655 / LMG 21543 / TTB310) TaxID=365046 RepID=F5Y4G7_RAMTT|nr:NAD(P)-dependent oxidoreductase [Ramlibacter tataouinensis]AEG93814.1 TsaR [Ramlibacter tataouinensis TTB310]
MSLRGPFGPHSAIGFVGLGVMGGGMARCLLRKGCRLQVYARQPQVAQAFAQAGAQVAGQVSALGACDLVLLSLPDAAAVQQVLFGAGGLAAALQPGSCVVDTSTIAATSAREFGARLRERGIWFLDAPVSGGQQGAEAGTLGCMVGGPAEAVEACREVMGAFCKTLTHVGELGAGQTVKACNQVAVAGALLGVADAIALARQQGVDPALMREVLLGGSARSFSLEKHGPRIIEGSFTPGFRAQLMRKDLRLALETVQAGGGVLPAAALAERLLDELCEGGRADWDWCALALQVQQMNGMPIPRQQEPSS